MKSMLTFGAPNPWVQWVGGVRCLRPIQRAKNKLDAFSNGKAFELLTSGKLLRDKLLCQYCSSLLRNVFSNIYCQIFIEPN